MNKAFAVFLLIFGFIWGPSIGQEISPPTSCYIIQNVEATIKPGEVIKDCDVLIRDGIITDVGKDLKVPYDAKIIAGDSMYLYAGFIDAYSQIGLQSKDSKSEEDDKPKVPGRATMHQSGIRPQNDVLNALNVKANNISKFREVGFVASHTAPKGYILKGNTAILSLKSGKNSEDMVLKSNYAMAGSLHTRHRVYPSTLIGAMASLRNLGNNTNNYIYNNQDYESSALGKLKPNFSKEYAAFTPVMQKKQKLYFDARKPKQIFRAIELKNELGFELVLANVEWITPILDQIDASIPILLSLKLPKEIKEAKDKKKDEKKNEQKELTKRKKESYDQYLEQAKVLADNNRLFAFSTYKQSASDVLKSIRRMVKAGLSEDTALKALTTNPAQILGLNGVLGTVEKGKIASIVIKSKSWLDKDAETKYVFVEGEMFQMASKKKVNKSVDLGNITGAWRFETGTPMGPQAGSFFIEKDGEDYEVKLELDSNPGEFIEASNEEASDKKLSFDLVIGEGDQALDISIILKFIDEFNLTGDVSMGAGMGSFTIEANKRMKPD